MKSGFPPIDNYKVMIECCTYNQSQYIEDALRGFAMQQTDFSFVCCVFDDASIDGEQDVIKRWMNNHCNPAEIDIYDHPLAIILMASDKENQNCIYAIHLQKINTWRKPEKREMIAHWEKQCEYKALCEGDDYWIDPLKLQKQVDFLDANPEYGMCYTKARVYNQKRKNNERIYGGPYTDFNHIITVNPIPTLTVVAKTDLILLYNQEIEPQKQQWLMGDYPMWLWFAHNSKIKFIDAVTGVYRVLKNSASHSSEYIKFIEFTQSGIDIQAFYKFLYTDEYTNRQYCTDLWLAELRGYAIYNERLKFMSIWKNGIKQDIYRLFVIKPYLYIIYFFSAKLRNDKL